MDHTKERIHWNIEREPLTNHKINYTNQCKAKLLEVDYDNNNATSGGSDGVSIRDFISGNEGNKNVEKQFGFIFDRTNPNTTIKKTFGGTKTGENNFTPT